MMPRLASTEESIDYCHECFKEKKGELLKRDYDEVDSYEFAIEDNYKCDECEEELTEKNYF